MLYIQRNRAGSQRLSHYAVQLDLGGALFTAILSFEQVSLTPLSYWIVLVLIMLTIVAVFFLVPPVQGEASKPLMNMPRFPKGTMPANIAIAIAWSVCGLVISILPAQLKLNGYELWVGPALFLLIWQVF